jgi:integrase
LEALAARHGDALAIEVAHVAQGAKTLEEAAVPWIAASDKESTRAQRRSVVDVLAATMKRRTSEILVERIGKAEVLSVVEAWEGEGLASSTIGNRVAVLSALWKLLASRGVVKVNPFHGVKPMKRSRGSRAEKRAFTAVEAAKVIALREEEPTSLRSCTMWALGFLTGARANELLTARDLEETKGATWFTVTPENAKTKSSARRVCVTGNDARKLLRAWVGMEKLDRASMSGGVRRFLDARGLGEDVDYHSTRRTFINLAERAGADPLGVMRFTGHQPSGMSFSLYSTSGSDAALEGVSKTVTATYGKPFAKVLTALAAAAK